MSAPETLTLNDLENMYLTHFEREKEDVILDIFNNDYTFEQVKDDGYKVYILAKGITQKQ